MISITYTTRHPSLGMPAARHAPGRPAGVRADRRLAGGSARQMGGRARPAGGRAGSPSCGSPCSPRRCPSRWHTIRPRRAPGRSACLRARRERVGCVGVCCAPPLPCLRVNPLLRRAALTLVHLLVQEGLVDGARLLARPQLKGVAHVDGPARLLPQQAAQDPRDGLRVRGIDLGARVVVTDVYQNQLRGRGMKSEAVVDDRGMVIAPAGSEPPPRSTAPGCSPGAA